MKHLKNGRAHTVRGTLKCKKSTMLTEKEHFTCKIYKNVGGTCPLCPPVPAPMIKGTDAQLGIFDGSGPILEKGHTKTF